MGRKNLIFNHPEMVGKDMIKTMVVGLFMRTCDLGI